MWQLRSDLLVLGARHLAPKIPEAAMNMSYEIVGLMELRQFQILLPVYVRYLF
jgi:hypothetical protein